MRIRLWYGCCKSGEKLWAYRQPGKRSCPDVDLWARLPGYSELG